MPKGVEHLLSALLRHSAGRPVILPLMPKGVEHKGVLMDTSQQQDFDGNLLQCRGNTWTYDGQPISGCNADTPRQDVVQAIRSGKIALPAGVGARVSGGSQGARSGTQQQSAR